MSHWKQKKVSKIKGLRSERLKELGLIQQEINFATKPPSNIIGLTEKGKLVSKKLKEIEEILKENWS